MTAHELFAELEIGAVSGEGFVHFDMDPGVHNELAEIRRSMGKDAVLTPRQAAVLLPMDTAAAYKWFLQEGLIRKLDGRSVVIWGDILAKLRGTDEVRQGWKPVLIGNLPRTKL